MKYPAQYTIDLKEVAIGYTSGNSSVVLSECINAHASAGELIALVGPNGTGKSTLIKTLSGLLPLLGGEFFIDGVNIQQLGRVEKSHKLSVVLTEPPYEGLMTVKELVALGRYPYTGWYGKLNDSDWHLVEQSIEQVHLKLKEQAPLVTLSDGERQRALIARMLAQDTTVCLLDEPTSHLDIPNQIEVFSLLRKLTRQQQKTILCSTHQLEIAMQLADRIWLFDAKGNFSQGCPESFLENNFLQSVFGNNLIRFDTSTLSFRIEQAANRDVFMDIPEKDSSIIEHLLRRNGYKLVHRNEEHTLTVSVSAQGWLLTTPLKEYLCPTIEELNSSLKKLKD